MEINSAMAERQIKKQLNVGATIGLPAKSGFEGHAVGTL